MRIFQHLLFRMSFFVRPAPSWSSEPFIMPKWKGSYDSGRKYNAEWEKEFPWVKRQSSGAEEAFCKICLRSMQPRKSNLVTHQKSAEHTRNSTGRATAPLNFPAVAGPSGSGGNQVALKTVELEIATTVACHMAILAVNHLGEVIARNGKGSCLQELKLHRTKCRSLLIKVIAPTFKEQLNEDLRGQKYALLVDEATDLSVDKNLCLCIRYFSPKEKRIRTEYLDLIPVLETTAAALFAKVKSCLEENNLSIMNCIGFSSDGASNMVGHTNSLWSRLRGENPDMELVPCSCHSLHLCIQKAFEKMPSALGFLLEEVPQWFSHSALRREEFRDLVKIMDPNNEGDAGDPFQKRSRTRWLATGPVASRILGNYYELLAYFSAVIPHAPQRCRMKAFLIKEKLQDETNYLLLNFLVPIIKDFERINMLFQASDADPSRMFNELDILFKATKSRVFEPSGHQKAQTQVDYGAKFLLEVEKSKRQKAGDPTWPGKVESTKVRCTDFLKEAIAQVEKRLPRSRDMFQSLAYLSPTRVLNQAMRVSFKDLPMLALVQGKEDVVESQYQRILFHPWKEEPLFQDEIPTDPAKFWAIIWQYEREDGERTYKELAE